MDWVGEEERWDWRNTIGDSYAWGWKLGFSRMIKFSFHFVFWDMHRYLIKRETGFHKAPSSLAKQ
jgi:hypothetical protein